MPICHGELAPLNSIFWWVRRPHIFHWVKSSCWMRENHYMLMFTIRICDCEPPYFLMVKSPFLFVESNILDGSRFKFHPSHVQTASSYLWQLSHGCARGVQAEDQFDIKSFILFIHYIQWGSSLKSKVGFR